MRLGFCGNISDAAAVRDAGFDFLEVNVQQVLQGKLSDVDWQRTAPDPDKLPLPIEAANCLIPGDMPVIGPKRDLDALQHYMKNVALRASRLGIWTLVFGSGGARKRPDDVSPKIASNHLADFLDIAGDACASKRVTIVIEHLNRNETNTLNSLADALELCERVSNPAVQMLVDTYHYGLEREDEQAVIDLGDRLRHVHVAEPVGRIQPGGHGDTSPDSFDFTGFFAVLSKIGYDSRVSFEGKLTAPLPECGPSIVAFLREAWQAAREGVAG
jgi:D-psicose/D-tagatose/L-ribulose 3-epimerase